MTFHFSCQMIYLLFFPRFLPRSWVQFSPHIDLQTKNIEQHLAEEYQCSVNCFSMRVLKMNDTFTSCRVCLETIHTHFNL